MTLSRLFKGREILELPKLRPGAPLVAEVSRLSPMLNGIIRQCLNDKVLRVAFGVDLDANYCFMLYLLPTASNPSAWWEMCPPPGRVFPLLFQYLVTLLDEIEYDDQGRLNGVIRARLNQEPFTVYFRSECCKSFELFWDESVKLTTPFCLARDSEFIEPSRPHRT